MNTEEKLLRENELLKSKCKMLMLKIKHADDYVLQEHLDHAIMLIDQGLAK